MCTILCLYFVVCARCRAAKSFMVIRLPSMGTVAAGSVAAGGTGEGDGCVAVAGVVGGGIGSADAAGDVVGGVSSTMLPFENLRPFKSDPPEGSFNTCERAVSNTRTLLSASESM